MGLALELYRSLYPGGYKPVDSPKKCPTILYVVNLCLKPVSATGANMCVGIFIGRPVKPAFKASYREQATAKLDQLVLLSPTNMIKYRTSHIFVFIKLIDSKCLQV